MIWRGKADQGRTTGATLELCVPPGAPVQRRHQD